MHMYYYVASNAPVIGLMAFLLVNIIRKEIFLRARRKACVMVLIVFAFTVASVSAAIFLISSESNGSHNPGIGIILVPALDGLIRGLSIIILYIILKLGAKICATLMRSPP